MYRLISVIFIFSIFSLCEAQNSIIRDVTVKDLKTRIESPSDTVYVVNFWATWCQPCVKEIPEFNKIPNFYRQRPVKVIMANLDFANQKEQRVVPFIKDNKITHEVIMTITPRGGEWIESIDKSWSGAIPATIIWHKGKYYFHEGETDYIKIKEWIESLL